MGGESSQTVLLQLGVKRRTTEPEHARCIAALASALGERAL
jgi:hypothetical protein